MNPHARPILDGRFFLILLCVAAFLVYSSLPRVAYKPGADEGYYLNYATRMSTEGISSFPGMFSDYVHNRAHWIFPSPLRVAYITLAGAWVSLFGPSYIALSWLSLCCYCGALAVSYCFCRKYYGETTAFFFSMLIAFSPLNMAMARRALVDGPANMCAIVAVWLLFDAVDEGNGMRRALFVGVYAITILMKEVLVLLAPVFAIYLGILKYVKKQQVSLRDILLITVCPPLLALGVCILASGNAADVFKVIQIIMTSPAANRYANLYCSGAWISYLVDFILLSPWVCILAIGYFFSQMCMPQRREGDRYFSVLGVCYLFSLIFFVKNVRYAMLLDTPLRLFAVLMIQRIAETYTPRHAIVVCALCVAAISVFDYILFYNIFVLHNLYDPVSMYLLQERRLIPAG
ncbi:MAG: glycosyltransferase family 39 protein [Candidatus Aureabacteria bacterium]|nr:glycosyltransferase family 39 protein [Candidatus Auribacterota bacterium]